MKKLLFAAMATTLMLSACSKDEETAPYEVPFTLASTTAIGSDRATAFEIESKIKFNNTTAKNLEIVWQRFEVNMPEGWESAVCDNELCHDPSISTQTMYVTAHEEFYFKSVMRPAGIAGTGTCKIRLYDKADSARSVQVIDYTVIAE